MNEKSANNKTWKEDLLEKLTKMAEEFRVSGARYLVVWKDKKGYDDYVEYLRNPTGEVRVIMKPNYFYVQSPEELTRDHYVGHMGWYGFTAENMVPEYIIWEEWYNLFHFLKETIEKATDRWLLVTNQDLACECAQNVHIPDCNANIIRDLDVANHAVFLINDKRETLKDRFLLQTKAGLPPIYLLDWLYVNGWKVTNISVEPVPGI